jgi:GNAT superfamily N-acetyltransferase
MMAIRPVARADIALLVDWHARCFAVPADVPPRDAVRAARKLFSPATLARSVGFIAQSDRRPVGAVLATEVRSPWSRQAREGVVHCALFESDLPRQCIANLIGAIEQAAETRGWTLLRSRLPRAASKSIAGGSAWHFVRFDVRRVFAPNEQPDVNGPAQVRFARASDATFIAELTLYGLKAGMAPPEKQLYGDVGDAAARRYVHEVLQSNPCILIAEIEGQRVGQAVVSMTHYNELSGRNEALIHDIFTIAAFQRRGIAGQLCRCVERVAIDLGLRSINATVSAPTPEAAADIARALEGSGWQIVSAVHCKRLPQISPSRGRPASRTSAGAKAMRARRIATSLNRQNES